MTDLISEYLDSLPPDERYEQERAINETPWLRLAMERALDCTDEERTQLMAEFELWQESGDLEPGSLLAELVAEGEEVKQAEAAARVRASGGRSPLLRFLARSRLRSRASTELERAFSSAPAPEQAYLYSLLDFGSELILLERDHDADAVARLRAHGFDALQLPGPTYPRVVLVAAKVAEAAQQVLPAMSETLLEMLPGRHDFAADARHLRTEFPWGYWLSSSVSHAAADLLAAGLGVTDAEAQGRLLDAVKSWQRLMWISECLEKQGLYLGGRREPFPPRQDEIASLLCELSYDLEPILQAPELMRELPLRPDAYLYRRHATPRLLEQMRVRSQPELAESLIAAIRNERHYTLDHIARIELGGRYGLERLTLAPEHWNGDTGIVSFLAAHKRGTFLGETRIGPAGFTEFGWPALTNVPAFSHYEPGSVEGWAELYAPLTNLVLAAWRNIVVPRVRDEHYELSVRRKPKGSGQRGARQARRGDVAVVEYLPRTLALRRAEEEERRQRGEKAPLRRVYRVGNFVKALPDGQQRSAEADSFAREIGMPLAPWQTVVRAHFRGGTPEEREAAEATESIPLREWRSWDALDLLAER